MEKTWILTNAKIGNEDTKVKPDLAKQWVQTAVAGGVFTSNEDNQVFHHSSSGITNSINSAMRSNFAVQSG